MPMVFADPIDIPEYVLKYFNRHKISRVRPNIDV